MQDVGLSVDNQYLSIFNLSKFSKLCIISKMEVIHYKGLTFSIPIQESHHPNFE
jgi:hypothetical protein